jgi:predicted cupin superfamily sugar epimerase
VTEFIERFGLSPHPEGGWFTETWRSSVWFDLPSYPGPRRAATAIYFALHPGERSRWHSVRSAEIWLWHLGGHLRLRLGGNSESPVADEEILLGPDAALQAVVPAGTWQEAWPAGDEPVLVSCVVPPGFEYEDFRLAD